MTAKLTDAQREVALRVLQDILPGCGTMIVSNGDFIEFAARFLAALPKPEVVAWYGAVRQMQALDQQALRDLPASAEDGEPRPIRKSRHSEGGEVEWIAPAQTDRGLRRPASVIPSSSLGRLHCD